jgi:hypothetical protein
MQALNSAKLIFKERFDERLAFEVEQKGWCGIGVVELPNGDRMNVFFYDPVRLAQDLEADMKSGEVCIAEPGLIVIPKVTLQYMEAAVKQLFENGYFNSLVPSSRGLILKIAAFGPMIKAGHLPSFWIRSTPDPSPG